jgi:hypothetical protein
MTEHEDGCEQLKSATDEEWREAHQALIDAGIIDPDGDGRYVWAPGVPAEDIPGDIYG